jgi:hypothetical protein
MLNSVLYCSEEGKVLFTRKGIDGNLVLISEGLRGLSAKWYTGVNTGVETKALATPLSDTSILLTDLIITSTKKVALSTVVVQFSDGVNTKILMEIEAASAPVQFSHAFVGGLTGWKDAVLQIVTNQAAMNVTTMIGYVKISEALTKTYNEWDIGR